MTLKRKVSRRKPLKPLKKRPETGSEQRKKFMKLLEQFKGVGKGIWNEDAQEYVNRLRGDDRSSDFH